MKGKLEQGMAAPALAAGKTSGGHFTAGLAGSVAKRGHGIGRSLASHLGLGFAALGVGSIVKSSVQLEASFSKTLSQLAIATGAPKSAMKGLHDTALKMGADTVFSANQAADAMLELGKSGISTKDIMGGGIKGTLTLAAAGSLDLASAATIASNAMNTFHLRGKDMGKIAAALAGGANASTASVESLGQALSQVGPGATNAGLSLQETVGTLAAFDQAGIKGSDAGTSLKTMLSRLTPQTDKAAAAIKKYNLDFVDSKGNFDSITTVAQKLQDHLGGLTQAQKTQALTTIFGSDATRAATVLMNDGAKGLGKFITATKDQSAAQKMANANMSGTAGALEQLSGSIDTAKLKIGEALAPTVRKFAGYLSGQAIPAFTTFIGQMQSGKGAGGALAHDLGLVADAAKTAAHWGLAVGKAFSSLPDWAKKGIVLGGGAAVLATKVPGVKGLLGAGAKAAGITGGVQKVFVTNPGFGKGLPGGGVPAGGAPVGAAAKGSRLAKLAPLAVNAAGWVAIAKAADALDNKLFHTSLTTKGLSGELATLGKTGHASGGLAKTYGKDLGDFSKTASLVTGPSGVLAKINHGFGRLFGQDGSGKAIDNVKKLDTALAGLSKANPGAGIKAYNAVLARSGKSSSELNHILPKTAAAMRAAGDAARRAAANRLANSFTTGASRAVLLSSALRKTGMSAKEYGNKLHSLPKFVQTKVTTPGAVTSRAQVKALGHQFGLTPRQVRTLMQLAGVNGAITQAARARAAYAAIPRYIHTQITTTRQMVNNPSLNKPRNFATGGSVFGPGTGTSDSIHARLSNGEFVVNARAAAKYRSQLEAINAQRFAAGGSVGSSSLASGGGGTTRIVLDAGGGVTLTGHIDNRITGRAALAATLARQGGSR